MNYNNSDVVQCLRQYEMFANSLKLIRTTEEREMIIKQLTKLQNKIISLTNEIYEEEYKALMSRECSLLSEERKRIGELIDLINQRLSYVEQRCNNHYQLTGVSIDAPVVLGVDDLDELENKLKIIDKYTKNVKAKQELEEDINSLTNKISLASEKIEINKSLNIELESVLKNVLANAFDKLRLYDLLDNKEDIQEAYDDSQNLLNIARDNLLTAKNNHPELISECEKMLNDISNDYLNCKDEVNTIKLLEIYNDEVNDYEGLIAKRKQINELVSNIRNQELLDMIMDVITKQYNTILMEQQDINTFDDLALERERKIVILADIENENNSEEFQSILRVLIENEKKQQEKILEEQRKIEAEERQRRLEIERKKQEEVLKRQKIIEDARKKEMEKRTRQMLEEQQNSVLNSKKAPEKVSFETIKDDIPNIDSDEDSDQKKENALKSGINLKNEEDNVVHKNKEEIEKELFAEFKNKQDDNKPVSDDVFNRIDEKLGNNKFPDMSIDEYMKNFDENKIEDTNSLFEEEGFPSIPL